MVAQTHCLCLNTIIWYPALITSVQLDDKILIMSRAWAMSILQFWILGFLSQHDGTSMKMHINYFRKMLSFFVREEYVFFKLAALHARLYLELDFLEVLDWVLGRILS